MPSEGGGDTGGAWLSSARVVRCLVESCNERNPRRQLLRPFSLGGGEQETGETAAESRRKVGTTSSPHGPYGMGYTRATMAVTMG